MSESLVCLPKQLPKKLWVSAARIAIEINPMNRPRLERLAMLIPGFNPTPDRISVATTKYWHTKGVRLTVGFLDNPPVALRTRILSHMNAWNKRCNVRFVASNTNPQVRIARADGRNGGYWSYLGVDILSIPSDEATMNLEGFTMNTPESEFRRVVRHETGHTLGSPHEHMRRELVALIDPKKAIAFFGATQGWDPDMVRRQVLTPIEESSLFGTAHADPKSIMCYQIPGTITKNGQPIIGGLDIDALDYSFMAKIYPKPSNNGASGIKGSSKDGAGVNAKRGGSAKASTKARAKSSSKAGGVGGWRGRATRRGARASKAGTKSGAKRSM